MSPSLTEKEGREEMDISGAGATASEERYISFYLFLMTLIREIFIFI